MAVVSICHYAIMKHYSLIPRLPNIWAGDETRHCKLYLVSSLEIWDKHLETILI